MEQKIYRLNEFATLLNVDVKTLNYGAIGYAVFGEGVLSIPIALFVLWIACLLAIFEVDVISKLWNFAKKKWGGRKNG